MDSKNEYEVLPGVQRPILAIQAAGGGLKVAKAHSFRSGQAGPVRYALADPDRQEWITGEFENDLDSQIQVYLSYISDDYECTHN